MARGWEGTDLPPGSQRIAHGCGHYHQPGVSGRDSQTVVHDAGERGRMGCDRRRQALSGCHAAFAVAAECQHTYHGGAELGSRAEEMNAGTKLGPYEIVSGHD